MSIVAFSIVSMQIYFVCCLFSTAVYIVFEFIDHLCNNNIPIVNLFSLS